MNPYAEFARIQHPRNGAQGSGPAVGADPLAETLSRAAFRAIDAIDEAVGALIERLRAERRRRLTIRELSALDDHSLQDIGLQRSQIRSVAHALAAGGEPSRGADGDARDGLRSQCRASLSPC